MPMPSFRQLFSSFWQQSAHSPVRSRSRRAAYRSFPCLELLEDRLVPALNFGPAGVLLGAQGTMVLTDFNRDGTPDYVVAGFQKETVSVFLGRGTGAFAPAGTDPVGPGDGPMLAADLNGDGTADLAVARGAAIQVFLSNGDGTLRPSARLAQDSQVLDLKAGDMNQDGKLDLVVVNSGGSSGVALSVLPGSGDGTFQPGGGHLLDTFSPRMSLDLGDFNADGKLDAVVTVFNQRQILVLGNDGAGSFEQLSVISYSNLPVGISEQVRPVFVVARDFTSDGNPDLVVAQAGSSVTDRPGLLLFRGEGNGTFSFLQSILFSDDTLSIAVTDLNTDGKLDLIAGMEGDRIGLALGNGDGTFSWQLEISSPGASRFVAAADLNRDGALDLVAWTDTGSQARSVINVGDRWQYAVTRVAEPTSYPYPFGEPLTANIEVRPLGSQGVPTGKVSLFQETAQGLLPLAEVPLNSNGSATYTTVPPSGKFRLVAQYEGDGTCLPSVDATTFEVAGFPATMTLTAAPDPALPNQPVTVTIKLAPDPRVIDTGVGLPTGEVMVSLKEWHNEGGNLTSSTSLGRVRIGTDGVATLTVSLQPGLHTLEAAYVGDTNYAAWTTSAQLDIRVFGQSAPGFTPNQGFMVQAYLHLLDRAIDPQGLAYWSGLLDQGHSRQTVVQAIQASPEYRAVLVHRTYRALFGRAADQQGLATWAPFLTTGTQEDLRSLLLSTNEFRNYQDFSRLSIEQQVRGILYLVLRRLPTNAERQYFEPLVKSESDLVHVANIAQDSSEAESIEVRETFRRILARNPDSASVNFFATQMATDQLSPEGLEATLISSLEFYNLANVGLYRDMVRRFYTDLLGRTPGTEERNYWVGLLFQGQSPAQVAEQLQATAEYRTRMVQSYYGALLQRDADSGGLTYFVSFLNSNGTLPQVQAALIGSAEYLANRGNSSNEGFLTALYEDVLGRVPDAGGRQVFLQALSQGAAREQVAATILGSVEYRARVVLGLYQNLFGREADAAGLAFWVNALANGLQEEELIGGLVASNEYLLRGPQ